MADDRPTGFPEHPFQPHFARSQTENHEGHNIPIPPQPSQTGDDEALTALKRFSSFSQISDSGDNQLNDENPERNEEHAQQKKAENHKNIVYPAQQKKTENQENIAYLAEQKKTEYAENIVYPAQQKKADYAENNAYPVKSDRNEECSLILVNNNTSPEDNERADPQVSLENDLDKDPDQTKEKLVVNMDKMNSNKLTHKAVCLAVPDNEKREKVCLPKINNISALTPNILVNQNNAGDKLVRKLPHEHIEYLNDSLLPFYGKNWKNIASLHGWDNEKICQFCHKFNASAFKELILREDFFTYKVKDLLVDLNLCQRKDLIASYPSQWG